jgi:hypothetical protein
MEAGRVDAGEVRNRDRKRDQEGMRVCSMYASVGTLDSHVSP